MPGGQIDGSVATKDIKRAMLALRSVDKDMAKLWRAHAKNKIAEPMARDLRRAAPWGAKGAAAANSIKTGTGALPVIWAGKGTWQGWQPFFALEFGMNHRTKHTYIMNRRGSRYVVRRRVGTWAPVHQGQFGYWFHPALEKSVDVYRPKVAALADEFLRSL